MTLTPPIRMSLEEVIAYIADDELVEVTPNAFRLRKRLLDANERKRARPRRKRRWGEDRNRSAPAYLRKLQRGKARRKSGELPYGCAIP